MTDADAAAGFAALSAFAEDAPAIGRMAARYGVDAATAFADARAAIHRGIAHSAAGELADADLAEAFAATDRLIEILDGLDPHLDAVQLVKSWTRPRS